MSIESKEVKDIYALYQNINEETARERMRKNIERVKNPFGNTTIQTQDGKELKQGDPGFKDALSKARQTVRNAQSKVSGNNNSSSSSSSSSTVVKKETPVVKKETPPAPKLDRESGTPDKRTPPKVNRDEVGSKEEPVVTMGRKSGSERRISQQKIRDERSTTPSIRTGRGQGNRTVVTNPNRQGGEKAKEILDKKSSDAKIDKEVDKYVADRKVPINKDLTIDKSEEGKAKYAEKAAERTAKETEKDIKVDPPKPVKMHSLEKKNRARFGDDAIDKLKAKQVDFRKMQSKDMSKDDFIKKYPKSITAQKAAGLRDHFDAFDIVLGYLEETQQADSLDEALYIMMEMDAATIQGIVRDSEFITEEEYDRQKDRQLERGGAGAGDGDNPSTRKPNYGSKQTDAQKKKSQENSKKAFNTVVDRLRNKYGNNAIVTNSHLKTAKKKKEEAKNK